MPTYTQKLPFTRNYVVNGTGGCFGGSDVSSEYTADLDYEITANEKVPNWRRKIARGQQATGVYAGSITELTYTPAHLFARKWCLTAQKWAGEFSNGVISPVTGSLGKPSAPVGSIDATTDAQALSQYASRLRDAQGSFRGSTFVAELGDTLRQIRNPAVGIRGLLDLYHGKARKNIRKSINRDPLGVRASDLSERQFKQATRALSETWLEYSFGIIPLMGDAADAQKALGRLGKREPRVPVRATVENVSPPTITFTSGDNSLLTTIRTEVHDRLISSVSYYGAVKLRTTALYSSVIEEAGFRTRDFVPALWEWIPYSFLVDYFTNVGDVIEAACFPRSDVAWTGRTWRNIVERNGIRSIITPTNGAPFGTTGHTQIREWTPQQTIWRRKVFSRAPYTGSLTPSLSIEIYGMNSVKRKLNIAALLALRGMRR